MTGPRLPAPSAWLLGIGRFIGAGLIAYVFVVLLMTLMAQDSVLIRIAAADQAMSYSGALARVREDESRLRDARQLRSDVLALETRANSLEGEIAAAQIVLSSTRARFSRIAARIRLRCGLEYDRSDLESLDSVWHQAFSCSREHDFPTAIRQEIDHLHSSEGNEHVRNLPSQADQLRQLSNHLRDAQRRRALLISQFQDLRRELGEGDAFRTAFLEIRALRDRWYFGGGQLLAFPPALLQLPLAAVSGAFGALLVSLIVIVYPGARVTTARTDSAARAVLLGALMAIGLYVMLLGGTAILGSTARLGEDGGNYMTFSAVGILAGMFSDRVAAWMSARADYFFSDRSSGTAGENNT